MNHVVKKFCFLLVSSAALLPSTLQAASPRTIDAMFVSLSVCGAPAVPFTTISAMLPNLKQALVTCSGNRTRLNPVVWPRPVPVARSCYNGCDYQSWAMEAEASIGAGSLHKHMVYVLPQSTTCPWAGLGEVGCSKISKMCRVWISGDTAQYTDTYFHELGHNLGLSHAQDRSKEYGDSTCAMGYCCWSRCYNAPHNEQLAWAHPLYVIKTNGKYTVRIPDARSRFNNGTYVRIETPGGPWLYVEYRGRTPPIDSGLSNPSLNIYSVAKGNALGSNTVLQASLRFKTDIWTHTPSGISVRPLSAVLDKGKYVDVVVDFPLWL